MKNNSLEVIIYQLEVERVLNCSTEEANAVLVAISSSIELKETNPELGPVFDLQKIAEAKNTIGCNVEQALRILYALQQIPEINSPDIYPKIKDFVEIVGCDPEDAIAVLAKMKEQNESFAYHEIRDFIKRVGCNLEEATKALIAMKKIKMPFNRAIVGIKPVINKLKCSPIDAALTMHELGDIDDKQKALINYDKILEAKEGIGCQPCEAVKILVILNEVNNTISYSDIKKGVQEMGLDALDTTLVLCKLQHFKALGFKPSFNLAKIPEAMQQIDCNAMEAVTVLLDLQLNGSKDITVPLSEIKTIKDLIGGDNNLSLATEIAIKKQQYKLNKISKEEWLDYLGTDKLKFIKSSVIDEMKLMPSDSSLSQNRNDKQKADELIADLERMTATQRSKPSNADENSKLNKNTNKKSGKLEFRSGFLNSKKRKKKKGKGV